MPAVSGTVLFHRLKLLNYRLVDSEKWSGE